MKAALFTIMMITNTHIEADIKLEQIALVRLESMEECEKARKIWHERMGVLLDAHISTRYYAVCHEL